MAVRGESVKFCSECGATVNLVIPDDDDRLRHVCSACAMVHYVNPKVIVGCLPAVGDKILLCKRAIEPRYGKWTLPAGFMELGETAAQGAARETVEEAGAQFEMQELFSIMNVVRVGQVHFFYRARLTSDIFDPGHETMEARLFSEQDIPWEDIAFRTVKQTLQCFFADMKSKNYVLHQVDIE